MPNLGERRWRFTVFPAVYLSQGLVAGFATTALVNDFVAAGSSVSDVGRHLAIVGLPWLLQPILWGPLIDGARARAMGRYRFWLVVAICGAQSSLAALLLLGGRPGLGVVSIVLLAHSTFASLMDTTTDRLIVGTVPTGDLGRMTACTRAAFAIGGAIGTAVSGELLARGGFAITAGVLLAATTAVLSICAIVRERASDPLPSMATDRGATEVGTTGRRLAALGRQLVSRRMVTLLLLCFMVDFVVALVQVPLAARMIGEHGWDAVALSRYQALLALAGGTLVAALAGLVVDRTGASRALATWLLVAALIFAALAVLALSSSGAAADAVTMGILVAIMPVTYIVLIPYLIDIVRDAPSSATLFQTFMATLNFGDIAGAAVAGSADATLPAAGILLGAALLMACFRRALSR